MADWLGRCDGCGGKLWAMTADGVMGAWTPDGRELCGDCLLVEYRAATSRLNGSEGR